MTAPNNWTELEAVNRMLSAISESPVQSLDDVTDVDAGDALTMLRATSREVQIEGWDFNTDLGMKLLPDASGFVLLPAGTLQVDPCDTSDRLVQRGARFYDPTRHTFIINRPVVVDLVTALEFDDLPPAAQNYIAIRAVRLFTDDKSASTTVHSIKSDDEQTARVELERAHTATQDINLMPAWRSTYRRP